MGRLTTSPNGIATGRRAEIARAFKLGGYVTVYEADAFLRLERGTTRRAVIDGLLPARAQPRGRKTRYLVSAHAVEAFFSGSVKA